MCPRDGLGCTLCFASEQAQNIQELATRAHDMELTITYCGRWLNDDESVASSRNESSILRDFEEKEYLYSDFDVPEMLDKLLQKDL